MKTRLSLATLASLLIPSVASADVITGQVVDANGVGVHGVDIDVKNLGGGGDPTPMNDGTDPDGFFTTTIPAGFYRVTFTPPPPPTTTHLIAEVDEVTVIGSTDMGVIALGAGVSVSARVVDSLSFPVANVNIDVVDLSLGEQLDLVGDTTDAFGQFSIAVPETEIELRFKTAGVAGPTLAPKAMDLTLAGNTALGDVTLEPGFFVSGHLQDSGGSPVTDTDLDLLDSNTGVKIYTPGDNTDGSGDFAVVVPGGTWDLVACPRIETLLAATSVPNNVVAADVNLGNVIAPDGVLLSGTIRDWSGLPHPGADVDVELASTSTDVVLCNDNGDGAGDYAVVVPPGTYDVTFSPKGFSQPLGRGVQLDVVVTSASLLDGTLPPCQFSTPYGFASKGTGGVAPLLASMGGAPRGGNAQWAWRVKHGLGGAAAVFFLSTARVDLPVYGGATLVNPPARLFAFPLVLEGPAGVPGAGSGTFAPPLPIAPFLVGRTFFAKVAVLDPFGPAGLAVSNGLETTFCD